MPVKDDPANAEKLDAIRELQRSQAWGYVAERINEEIERHRKGLEGPKDMQETATLRGAIGALRMVLTIPEIIEGECKES